MIILLSSLIISMGCAPRFDQMSNKLKNPNKVKYSSKQIDEDYYLYTEKFISSKDYHRPLNYMRWNMTENHQTLQNLKKIRGMMVGWKARNFSIRDYNLYGAGQRDLKREAEDKNQIEKIYYGKLQLQLYHGYRTTGDSDIQNNRLPFTEQEYSQVMKKNSGVKGIMYAYRSPRRKGEDIFEEGTYLKKFKCLGVYVGEGRVNRIGDCDLNDPEHKKKNEEVTSKFVSSGYRYVSQMIGQKFISGKAPDKEFKDFNGNPTRMDLAQGWGSLRNDKVFYSPSCYVLRPNQDPGIVPSSGKSIYKRAGEDKWNDSCKEDLFDLNDLKELDGNIKEDYALLILYINPPEEWDNYDAYLKETKKEKIIIADHLNSKKSRLIKSIVDELSNTKDSHKKRLLINKYIKMSDN